MSSKVARSAKTGRFVKKSYARRHPNTTVMDTVSVKSKPKRTTTVVRDKATGKFVSMAKAEEILGAGDVVIERVKR